MKAFRPLTLNEQRENYPRLLTRQYNRAKKNLAYQFQDDLDRANELEQEASNLEPRIEAIQNYIADKADIKYKGWDKWRQDPTLLKRVASEMFNASRGIQGRQIFLRTRAANLRKPFLKEISRLEGIQQKLLRECAI